MDANLPLPGEAINQSCTPVCLDHMLFFDKLTKCQEVESDQAVDAKGGPRTGPPLSARSVICKSLPASKAKKAPS
jgi:hypothetical protein